MATRTNRHRPPEAAEGGALAAPSEPADAVLVGRVVGAWGVRGWLRVVPFNDPRQSLLPQVSSWWLRGGGAVRAVEVERARPHGADEIVARIVGVDDRDAALALEGFEVLLSRAQFPAPDPGEVYWADLIGCTVLDPQGESLGVVVAIEDQPAHPLMRLSPASPSAEPLPGSPAGGSPPGESLPPSPQPAPTRVRERLIPLVPELLLSVDLDARVVVADWHADW